VSHLVLLGDSLFDNAAYTGGGPNDDKAKADVLAAGQGVLEESHSIAASEYGK
jgi:hypothetical protein